MSLLIVARGGVPARGFWDTELNPTPPWRPRLDDQGVQALRFQCSPYYVNSAFWPIIDNFERTLKFGRDETPDSKLEKLEALIVGDYGIYL